jgi:hypothetical protein
MAEILLATSEGILTFDGSGRPGEVQLADEPVTWVARAADDLLAVVGGAEIRRRDGDGWTDVATLDGLDVTTLMSIDGEPWIGTSEAHLFHVRDGGLGRDDAFDAVDGRDAWFTPWGGPPATRSIANWDDEVFVNVHVGGIPRTSDGGATWAPTIDIDADVHQVTTTEDLVLAACAGGIAVSPDRGDSWSLRTDGLHHVYSRAVAVCGDQVFATSSDGPRGGRGAVYRGGLRGDGFERCDAGPGWFDGNIDSHHLDALMEGPFVAFASPEGDVYASEDAGASWDRVAEGLRGIRRLLVMP